MFPVFRSASILLVLVGCGSVDTAHPPDARLVDAPTTCDPSAPFGAPVPVAGLATAALEEGTVRLSADELTAYFEGRVAGGSWDLYVAHRTATTAAFESPIAIAAENTAALESEPAVSTDGLTLWFRSDRVTGEGTHIYVATRGSVLAAFGAPGLAGAIEASDVQMSDAHPFITADGEELWFSSTRTPSAGAYDLWRATRSGTGFAAPTQVAELASAGDEWYPMLSADRLTIYFVSNRSGSYGVWTAHRTTVADAFSAPTLVPQIGSATWLSPDNCRLYGSANGDVFVASRML